MTNKIFFNFPCVHPISPAISELIIAAIEQIALPLEQANPMSYTYSRPDRCPLNSFISYAVFRARAFEVLDSLVPRHPPFSIM